MAANIDSIIFRNPPQPNPYLELVKLCEAQTDILTDQIIELSKEADRLREMLPLWARSGPTRVYGDGRTEGFSTYPMIKDEMPTNLTGAMVCQFIRYDEKYLADCLERRWIGHAAYQRKMTELAARLQAQRDEKRRVGLDLVEDKIQALDKQYSEYGTVCPRVDSLYEKWKATENQFARAELEEAILTLDDNGEEDLRIQIEVLRSIAESGPNRLVEAVKLLARAEPEEDDEEEEAEVAA